MNTLVASVYRTHAAALTARLARTFGLEHLETIESLVQEAFVTALQTWPVQGVPQNPAAWLTTVVKNAARDQLRRGKRFAQKTPELEAWILEAAPAPVEANFADEISDDLLRMMFVVCHPEVPEEARLALSLRTLCSFSIPDIARAFLTSEAAIEKRLVRARGKLRALDLQLELPSAEETQRRLGSVLDTLYLLFSGGYHAHTGDRAVRDDLCREALRLARLLAKHPLTNLPKSNALASLLCLQASRLDARVDAQGNLLQLAEQDRTRLDTALISEGLRFLERAGQGTAISAYHLQAGIAACHALAPSYEQTPWAEILRFYDRLQIVDDSPVVALNRAIALGYAVGPREAITTLERLRADPRLERYGPLHAALGEMFERAGDGEAARAAFQAALALAGNEAERRFIARKLERA